MILANVVREGAFREQPLSTLPTLEVVLPGLLLALPDLPVLPLDVPEEQLLTLAPPRTVRAADQVTSVQAHVHLHLFLHHILATHWTCAAPVGMDLGVHPQQVSAAVALVADAAPKLDGEGEYLYDIRTVL